MTKDKRQQKNIFFSIASIILLLTIILAGGEIICRVSYQLKQKLLNQRPEPLDYQDICYKEGMHISGYLKPNFDNLVTDGYGKLIRWKNNSFGFRYNKEVSIKPSNGRFRILLLGDSFAVGYRIDQEATLSSLLEKYFNNKKIEKKYEMLPANIDEPRFGLFYLSNFAEKFNPKIVLLGITLGNDISQNFATTRENCEYVLNFHNTSKDSFFSPCMGYIIGEESPKIPSECLNKKQNKNKIKNVDFLEHSMLYNMIIKFFKKYEGEPIICFYQTDEPRIHDLCSGLGLYLKNPHKETVDSYNLLFRTLNEYKKISKQYNFKLIVIIFPQRFQVQKEDWEVTIEEYGLNEECFDLMKPNNLILSFCRKEGINCIDPTLDMAAFYNKKRKSLYFSLGDMHFNALGNKVLYEAIKEKIYRLVAQS